MARPELERIAKIVAQYSKRSIKGVRLTQPPDGTTFIGEVQTIDDVVIPFRLVDTGKGWEYKEND